MKTLFLSTFRLPISAFNFLLSASSLAFLLASPGTACAATRYVDASSANPTPPYTSWSTAARVIQDAVDAASDGDTVLVTNGLYNTGGRTVGTGPLANRVATEKALRLESVNGPALTIIEGAPATAGDEHGNGDGAVRCVYLGSGNAVLSGFTLTNGHTQASGDWRDYSGGGALGSAVVTNCTLTGNSALYGGGASGSTLANCLLSGNSAAKGGAVSSGALYNCMLIENSASDGGGVSECRLYNCVLTGNTATGQHGLGLGGGADNSTLQNCTLSGNSASSGGGGAHNSTIYNSIAYFNRSVMGANYLNDDWTLMQIEYSCTSPLPPGPGNIDADPQLVSPTHLSASSPCRGAGNAGYASGLDIDGEPWATPPSMGADEPVPASAFGPLSMCITASCTNSAVGYSIRLTAQNTGRITQSAWDFGDGTTLTNQPFATHAWSIAGIYPVKLTGYNDSHPEGVSTSIIVQVVTVPVHYVNVANSTPLAPYTSWATAATNIQDAIDAGTTAGRLVLVTNGVYRSGMVERYGKNRVALTTPVVVRSVNGPEVTVIEGDRPNWETGEGFDIRCAYLGDGSAISGFTLTNGVANGLGGGGVFSDSFGAVTNCVINGNTAYYGGGASRCMLYDCRLINNTVSGMGMSGRGGGASWCTLNNCTLTGNLANGNGGGVAWCTLNNCTLSGNRAGSGGGASYSTLRNCTLTGNSAGWGGGVSGGTLYNCTLTDNSAYGDTGYGGGGGASDATLFSCTATSNSASIGGGAYDSVLYNCTITGNSAEEYGGGMDGGTLYNSIVYFNRAPLGANYSWGTFEYSCTTPLPPGPGNIDVDPQLLTSTHLSPSSPCRGAGSSTNASGVDIDGEPWAIPPSMGADEVVPGSSTGLLSMSIWASNTNVVPGFPVEFSAHNTGRITQSVWDFGDGTVLTNQPFTSHAWSTPGPYSVKLTGYNDSYPQGTATMLVVQVVDAVHYVNAANRTPAAPYASWTTAATNIQDAVDAAEAGGIVIVSNGVYVTHGRPVGPHRQMNRVTVGKPLTLRSLNGPDVTVIQGAGHGIGEEAVRCVYLAKGAMLLGFTLANGVTASAEWTYPTFRESGGGGVWCESVTALVSNCTIVNCSAGSGGGVFGGTLSKCRLIGNLANHEGGGAFGTTLNNCVLTGNSAGWACGGARDSKLSNCMLSSNSAYLGGGVGISTLYNCTLTSNSASSGGGSLGGALHNCTLVGNSADRGGGVWESTLYNCVVYFNTAKSETNYFQSESSGPISHSCTTPLPTNGVGNITADPRFVNAAAGDFRLRPDSPCIDAGTNLVDLLATDLLGLPRVMDGNSDGIARVDKGAYEFNPYRFEPTLRLTADGFRFTVHGEPGRSVLIERSRDLVNWEFAGQVPIPASGQTLIDPAATLEPKLFYRAMRVP